MNPIGMHYGFWSHNWDEIAYIPLMEKLAWLGFDICEVASAEWGYYDDARLRELKACADHNGLGITYSIGLEAKYDLASDDPAVRENGIRHVTRILESMPKVGATILNGVSYAGWQALPDHGITLDEKRRKEELALESMSRLMKVAEDCGVLYCCEVVNRFEQYLLNTAKEGVEFVKRLGSPNARVLLDTFHMNIEEDSLTDAIRKSGPLLGHFHVGEANRRCPGPNGRFDWAASGKFPQLSEPDPSYHGVRFTEAAGAAAYAVRIRAILLRDTGAALSPFNAFILLQGLETLSLRVERHVQNALKVVEYLSHHPGVVRVNHPALPGHPDHALYERYFPQGGGSIFTFEIRGGQEEAHRFIDSLESFSLLANVADVKSLVIHPATTTHSQLSPEELAAQGITPATVRLSVGTEHVDDLIADIEQALDAAVR